jgi:hypothetical protein
MALTDDNSANPARPAHPVNAPDVNAKVPETLRAPPSAALARLPQLRAENAGKLANAKFAQTAVPAAALLMLLGAGTLALANGAALETTLAQCFAWSVLVLLAVGALLRAYIRGAATAFDPVPLDETAKDLRAILLYAGFAWGAGAGLALSPAAGPGVTLCFAALPSILLALLMRDRDGVLGFVLGVTAMSGGIVLTHAWQDAGLLILLQGVIALAIVFGLRRTAPGSLPAGLALH